MQYERTHRDRGRNITIIVPVYECVAHLHKHSFSLRNYRNLGCQVVWVASPSPDGTDKFAQQICSETGDQFLLSPPGLYEAWNFGIARVKTEFVAISTISDAYINEDLFILEDLLRTLSADICFTPPALMGLTHKDIEELNTWPIFKFRSYFVPFSEKICPQDLLIATQLSSGLSCVLGSWASILARTAVLKDFPFPTAYNHYGDTAWFYKNILNMNFVFKAAPIAGFHFHEKPDYRRSDPKLAYLHFKELEKNLIQQARRKGGIIGDFLYFYRSYRAALHKLDKTRGKHPRRFWWISPRAWLLRCLTRQRNAKLKALSPLLRYRDIGINFSLFTHTTD